MTAPFDSNPRAGERQAMTDPERTLITRRQALATAGLTTLALALPGCATVPASATADRSQSGSALLDDFAWRLLELTPEEATSKGVDTGARAHLRARLEDRSAAGQARSKPVSSDSPERVGPLHCGQSMPGGAWPSRPAAVHARKRRNASVRRITYALRRSPPR
jgi:hypothetical protein